MLIQKIVQLYSYYYIIDGNAGNVYSPAIYTITEFNDPLHGSSLNSSSPKRIHLVNERKRQRRIMYNKYVDSTDLPDPLARQHNLGWNYVDWRVGTTLIG